MPKLHDLTGLSFGRWRVITEAGRNRHGHVLWKCQCQCGTDRVISAGDLRRGQTTSCGCFKRERATTHGWHRTPEYKIWQAMKNRCLNPHAERFDRYGPLGFHDGWVDDFPAFLAEIGPRPSPDHSVDRIDNSRGYFPGNVRWATKSEQQRNKH